MGHSMMEMIPPVLWIMKGKASPTVTPSFTSCFSWLLFTSWWPLPTGTGTYILWKLCLWNFWWLFRNSIVKHGVKYFLSSSLFPNVTAKWIWSQCEKWRLHFLAFAVTNIEIFSDLEIKIEIFMKLTFTEIHVDMIQQLVFLYF